MKFLHLSDLHIGKSVNGFSMLEEQKHAFKQVIEYIKSERPNAVVIAGDVNPGSEIIAHGNIIVLGALKGTAHAGAGGDNNCFVSALVLQPTHLRIADIYTYLPPERESRGKKLELQPEWAYIQDNELYIALL